MEFSTLFRVTKHIRRSPGAGVECRKTASQISLLCLFIYLFINYTTDNRKTVIIFIIITELIFCILITGIIIFDVNTRGCSRRE